MAKRLVAAPWLLLVSSVAFAAIAQDPPRPFIPIEHSVVIEVDTEERIVWKLDESPAPTSVAIRGGRRLVADNGGWVRVYDENGARAQELSVRGPSDADFLEGDRILVTSQAEGWVREYDVRGEVVWERKRLDRPRDAERLTNGNTLIVEATRVIEVDRKGNVVWSHDRDLDLPIRAIPDGDGNVLIAEYNGHRVTSVKRDGSIAWRINDIGHPSGLVALPDRSLLASVSYVGMIVRFDRELEQLDRWRFGGRVEAFDVSPEGRLLVALTPSAEARRESAFAPGRAAEVARLAVPNAAPVERRKRHLVLVLFDSLRWDHVPWSGYFRDTAPNLQELSRSALVFDQYIVHAPWTKPSVASLFTSTHPSEHGVVKQKDDVTLHRRFVTLAEALRDAGYFTAALMGNPYMKEGNPAEGFRQGFESYEYFQEIGHEAELPRRIGDRAVELINSRPTDRPLFLTIFLMNPHYPYQPKSAYFGSPLAGPSNPGPINDYDGEIFDGDIEIGRVIAALRGRDLLDRTVFVFTSDHGEEFGDHKHQLFHGKTLYDCVLRVPLFITGLGRTGRFPGLVREIDVLPTLLDYLNVPMSLDLAAQAQGVSLRKFIESDARTTGLAAYVETEFVDEIQLLGRRTEGALLVVDRLQKSVERYDLTRDPQQYNNLRGGSSEAAALLRWSETRRRPSKGASSAGRPLERAQLGAVEREQLRRLGYDPE